jgi:AraC family transcriptional regulator of adaptative response/methylated-DNA-[protein]-cysteine methyltransferase
MTSSPAESKAIANVEARMMQSRHSSASNSTDEDLLWQAVVGRDERYDDAFLYGVMTTGVYCRPSCSSRNPRRENVRYFADPQSAERAGLRPCKRCRPGADAGNAENCEVKRAVSCLSRNGEATLEDIATDLGLTPRGLDRAFQRRLGVSFRRFADATRMARFSAALDAGHKVADAVYEAGYGSSRAVYEQANRKLGMRPGQRLRGGSGVRVNYTILESEVGRVLVAATEHGLCEVSIGDGESELVTGLHERMDQATVERDDDRVRPYAEAFADYLAGSSDLVHMPIDVIGTAFQARVWDALRTIPRGQTVTYAALAERLGMPGGQRAVASACARNQVALAVPCHRVVPAKGGSGGYRWGPERKAWLLAHEADSPTT